MIYRKEINERSPLRVFERSIHGGLGRGNLGLVMSRAGVGKTAVLVGVALDDLMRDRKVLHVNTEDSADKVRSFYDEVFNELAEGSKLQNRSDVHRSVERNRMIHTYRSDTFSMGRLREALGYMDEHMHFKPDAMIIDGFPQWKTATEDQVRDLKKLAIDHDAELWLSMQTHREGEEHDERGVPNYLAPFESYISVIVNLEPKSDHVRLQLCKDHDNPDLADLHLELDLKTLLLKWR